MQMTLPQIIIMGHAAWANHERVKSSSDKQNTESTSSDDPIVNLGSTRKRMSQMTAEEHVMYFNLL